MDIYKFTFRALVVFYFTWLGHLKHNLGLSEHKRKTGIKKIRLFHLNFGFSGIFQMYRNTIKDRHPDKKNVLIFLQKEPSKAKKNPQEISEKTKIKWRTYR